MIPIPLRLPAPGRPSAALLAGCGGEADTATTDGRLRVSPKGVAFDLQPGRYGTSAPSPATTATGCRARGEPG